MTTNQFKTGRSAILFASVTRLLQTELFGDLGRHDYQKLIEIVDEFLDIQDDREHFPDHILAEVTNAIVSEVVVKFDAETIKEMIAESGIVMIDLKDISNEPRFTSDKLRPLADATHSVFPRNSTKRFIIASPLALSLIEACDDIEYSPIQEERFRGPNNTLLVGKTPKSDVYSYLFDRGSAVDILTGSYNPKTESYTYIAFSLRNMGF